MKFILILLLVFSKTIYAQQKSEIIIDSGKNNKIEVTQINNDGSLQDNKIKVSDSSNQINVKQESLKNSSSKNKIWSYLENFNLLLGISSGLATIIIYI